MSHKFKKYIILIFLLIPICSFAQNKFHIAGKVTNKTNGESVPFVAIQITELERWTTSNTKGEFVFENVPGGEYILEATCLAFEKFVLPLKVESNQSEIIIKLVETSLGLDEITVVAKENTSLSSSSKIENTAIEHVQPTNLADVMQLVPGQITLNPDLSGKNQITIRSINSTTNPNANEALGTAIIVDGTPLDNDANMQLLNTGSGIAQSYSTAGQGVDLRQIPTDNIESVEVIRGIPSVEYGELTAGAVVVKTKAGKSPINAKIKADPKIKQIAFSKGFLLPDKKLGAVNIDFDYTHSYNDLREPSHSFNRLAGQFAYSNTLFKETKPLSINVKVNYFRTFDSDNTDPDLLREEFDEKTEEGIGFKLYGKWSIQKDWLSNITYNISGSYSNQEYYEYRQLTNNGATPVPLALASGENEAYILETRYWSELTIDGKPFNYFGTIKADTKWKIKNLKNNLMYGFDWRSSGNSGDGRIYDPTQPPSGALTTRPRAFKDIPASQKLALFIENEFILPIGKTTLTTIAGVRYNNLLPKGVFTTKEKGYRTLEPRINSNYEILKFKRSRFVRDFSLRFGYGKTSKTPTMPHLYPDKAYKDETGFNYGTAMAVVTTNVIDDTSNPDLKPMTNEKWEIGANFNIKGVKFNITAFKETIKDGFNFTNHYYTMDYRLWDQLEGDGKNPYFENGDIYYTEDGQLKINDYQWLRVFHSYRSPINDYRVNKKGIEYIIDFGQIKQIRTSFRVDGAYFHINKINHTNQFAERINESYEGKKFPYLAIYANNEGGIDERLNSNIKTITHIPDLKMVFTITTQLVWINKNQDFWEKENGDPIAYSVGENNEKLYGQYDGVDKIQFDPIGFYDLEMNYHEWQDHFSFEAPYATMVKSKDSDNFVPNSYPILWQINLKLTKEFSKNAKLSFFANNVFNHKPFQLNKKEGTYSRKNQTAYFGAELKFSF